MIDLHIFRHRPVKTLARIAALAPVRGRGLWFKQMRSGAEGNAVTSRQFRAYLRVKEPLLSNHREIESPPTPTRQRLPWFHIIAEM